MKDIKKTLFMKEAASKKGHNILVEICIAVLLFFIGSVAMGFIQVPAMMAYLLSNKDYMSMIMTGRLDTQKMLSVMSDMPEWVMIVMLFAEILLTLIVLFYCRFFEKRKLSTLGFVKKGMVKQYVAGLLAGAAAFSLAYLICIITGSVKCEGLAADIVPLYIIGYFFGYLLQGMAEEVLCRGYLMVSLSRRYHVTLAIVVSSVFFAFLHSANSGLSPLAYINLFLFGVFASLLLLDFGNIWIAGAFHSIWNFVQGNIYGVQVSGTRVSNTILSTSYTDGREIINGGSFGMEGGFAVSIVFMAGIALLSYHLYKKGDIIDLQEPAGPVYQEENDAINITESSNIIIDRDANVLDSDIIKNNNPGYNGTDDTATDSSGDVQNTTFNQDYFKD
ncbi:MAG: CPBP family intramembrane metalloprotease [Lachnospiraceae bacterium]|nr:CPBP family intramembrane metalloprotease [Lachnospiraceae bacterium]